MDWIHLHLLANHFPIILGIVGACAALVAAFSKKDEAWRYAYVTVVLAAVTAPVAFLTGRQAEHLAEQLPGVSEALIHAHEDAALWALVALLVAGALAVAAWKKGGSTLRWVFFAAALLAAGAAVYTGFEGGQIEHGSPVLHQAVPDEV